MTGPFVTIMKTRILASSTIQEVLLNTRLWKEHEHYIVYIPSHLVASLLNQGFSLAKDRVRLKEEFKGSLFYFQNDALLSFKMRCSE